MKQVKRFLNWCENTTLGAVTLCLIAALAAVTIVVLAFGSIPPSKPDTAPAVSQPEGKDSNLGREVIKNRMNPLVGTPPARIINHVIDNTFGDD